MQHKGDPTLPTFASTAATSGGSSGSRAEGPLGGGAAPKRVPGRGPPLLPPTPPGGPLPVEGGAGGSWSVTVWILFFSVYSALCRA
jgi:hypothetical protein